MLDDHPEDTVRPGDTNSLTDVPGIRVGHRTAIGDGWLSGTTVVLAPPDGAVAGVDVRGGGPGTRETDLLDPRNLVERVHAVLLGGGSAFGLEAATGIVARLAAANVGLPVTDGVTVPIVPGAIVFDLGRGGEVGCRPDASFGAAAYDAAVGNEGDAAVGQGCVGAGTGAVAGGLKGGVGSASVVLPSGATVGALAVVNPFGSVWDPKTGELYGARYGLPGEFDELLPPSRAEVDAAQETRVRFPEAPVEIPVLNTTIGLIATDVLLTKAQCAKLAGIGHDGMARAIRPAHSMLDGDTVFALSVPQRVPPDPAQFHALLTAAADCFTRAVVSAVLAADSVTTPAGSWPSYRDAFPSAFRAGRPA
jgi:putative pantetheine hydrolase